MFGPWGHVVGGQAPQILPRTPTGASWEDYLRQRHSAPPGEQGSQGARGLVSRIIESAPAAANFAQRFMGGQMGSLVPPAAPTGAASFDEAGFNMPASVPLPPQRPQAPAAPQAPQPPQPPPGPQGFYGGSPETNPNLQPLPPLRPLTGDAGADRFGGFGGFMDRLSSMGKRSDAGLIPKFVHLLRG
jgi:hypothetical protein